MNTIRLCKREIERIKELFDMSETYEEEYESEF